MLTNLGQVLIITGEVKILQRGVEKNFKSKKKTKKLKILTDISSIIISIGLVSKFVQLSIVWFVNIISSNVDEWKVGSVIR